LNIYVKKGLKMSDISKKVKDIIVDHLGVEESKVTDTASLADDLGADSLDQAELVMKFEEAFSCEIPDEAAEKITTIESIINYIKENASHPKA
jgi:acyl carrier protein